MRPLSYSQRFEDYRLLRCFGAQQTGFYIDVGAGHPVYDNVSLAFYLRGWRGITVEPNPWLARLGEAVRPRDRMINALSGAAPGEAIFYLVDQYHGLSTMVAGNAQAARNAFGKAVREMRLRVTTLAAICETHAPAAIDFLKIDVEGAEADVLRGNDWKRFRPKIVAVEAVAPITMAPNHESYEPNLLPHGYRFAIFDGLNRYYTAEEEAELGRRLAAGPDMFDGVTQYRDCKPARDDSAHPDHALAALLETTPEARAAMVELPLMRPERLLALVTGGIPEARLDGPVTPGDAAAALARIFGPGGPPEGPPALGLPAGATLGEFYARIVETDSFRAACGRISGSLAW